MDEEKKIEQLIKQLDDGSLEDISGGALVSKDIRLQELLYLRKELSKEGREGLSQRHLADIERQIREIEKRKSLIKK